MVSQQFIKPSGQRACLRRRPAPAGLMRVLIALLTLLSSSLAGAATAQASDLPAPLPPTAALASATLSSAPLRGAAALAQLQTTGDDQRLAAALSAARYAIHPLDNSANFWAQNPAHGLQATFTPTGVTVTAPGVALNPTQPNAWYRTTWQLTSLGYGAAQQPVAAGTLRDRGTRVELRRPQVTEWFVNGPTGLEQGFTLPARPAANPSGAPLQLTLQVGGALPPQASADGQSLTLHNARGQVVLTYDHLTVWDATGATVPARLHTTGGRVQIVVADTTAHYPLTIDPTITQQAYLKAGNTGQYDNFGKSVAIAGDTVVVAASAEDSNATGVNGAGSDNSADSAGAAYVFVRSGATWSQQAYLKASNTDAYDYFGSSVAIAGNTVVVGATYESSNATGVNGDGSDNSTVGTGAVYVFVRNGATWSQQAYLKASNPDVTDNFGSSVAIAGDTVVVGAPYEDSNATGVNGNGSNNDAESAGAAYIFVRNGPVVGGTWSQQAYLKASNTGQNDNFGASVAAAGDTVVVGAPYEASGVNGDGSNNSAPYAGAAYVFVRNGPVVGGTWSQQAYLKASNTDAFDGFGSSVAVTGDTVVVGAVGEASNATGVNGNGSNNSAGGAGAAYVFVRSGATWSQRDYLKASNTDASDGFGSSVAVAGNTVVVGAGNEASNATGVNGNGNDNSADGAGAVYLFDPPSPLQMLAYMQGWGSKGSSAGQFNTPAGAAMDASGNLYIVDAGNHRIQKFTANGTFLTQWGTKGSGNGQFDIPTGIAVDSSNNVYVADSNNHRIQKFTATGTFLAQWGSNGSGNGQFRYPTGVTVNSSGFLFVADTGNHRVQVFTNGGVYITQWGTTATRPTSVGWSSRQASTAGSFSYPTGVATDSSGNAYVVNTGTSLIQKFDSNGTLLLEWGGNGSGDGQFSYPTSIAVDGSGNVYIADSNNGRVQQFDSDGNFLATLGNSGAGALGKPAGLATDSSGNLYIVDATNHQIQQFGLPQPTPALTVQGNGLTISSGDSTPSISDHSHFGGVVTGGNVVRTFTISNTGTAELAALAVTVNGNAAFSLTSTPAVTVAAGGNTTFQVTFTPSAVGMVTGTVSIASNDPAENPYTFAIQGLGLNATPAPIALVQGNGQSINPGAANPTLSDQTSFGGVLVNGTRVHTFTLANLGTADLTLSAVTVSGNAAFSLSGNPATTISAGSSSPFQVTFAPSSVGNAVATVSIASNDSSTSPYTFTVQGAGLETPPSYFIQWGSNGSGNGQFSNPLGMVVGNNGHRYVVDGYNNRIQFFDSSGAYLGQWGTTGSGNGQFDHPAGIAVDSAGNVYVADTANQRIQKFDSSGAYLAQWGTNGNGNGQFSYPAGVAVDSAGRVYVADTVNHRIQQFDSTGHFLAQWGSQGSNAGQFNAPAGVAVDSRNPNQIVVYVADTFNHRIQQFDSTGHFLAQWGSQGSGDGELNTPFSLAVDRRGHVYVADRYNQRIQKFTSTGRLLAQWGTPGSGDGQFSNPYGIAVDATDQIYVVDTSNNRIQQFAGLYPNLTVQGNGVLIANGDSTPDSADHTDFGTVNTGGVVTRTFTIQNSGMAALTGVAVTVNDNFCAARMSACATAANFSLVVAPAATIAAGSSSTFTVAFAPSAVGSVAGVVSIASHDSDETPYTFVVDGEGGAPQQATITIVLDAQPDLPTNLAFSGSLGGFLLDDPAIDDGDAYTNTKRFTVTPGTYTVRRNNPTGWFTTAIVCTPTANATIVLAQRRATLTVADGDNVTCTFSGARGVRIAARAFHDRVRRDTNLGKRNAGDPWLQGWTITVYNTPTATVASGVTQPNAAATLYEAVFSPLPPGLYTVCVTLPAAAWTPTMPNSVDGAYGQPCKTISLAPSRGATLLFGAYQPTTVAGESFTTEEETITDEDTIVDLPYDPAEDETATDEETVSHLFLPFVQR